jgi:hypothetical protein
MTKSGRTQRSPSLGLAGGALLVAVFIGLGILLITLLGGASWGGDDNNDAPPLPEMTGDPPAIERSAAADLLENKSFDDMTPDEVRLVRDEATRVFGDAEFRVTSEVIYGIDVVRRNGHTVASQQYQLSDNTPNKDVVLAQIIQFYCSGDKAGFVQAYRVDKTPFQSAFRQEEKAVSTLPFEVLLANLDWTQVRDVGYRDVEGRRTHGAALPYLTPNNQGVVITIIWLDVENARVLRREDRTNRSGVEQPYTFDWRTPPRIEATDDFETTPPCAASVYADS